MSTLQVYTCTTFLTHNFLNGAAFAKFATQETRGFFGEKIQYILQPFNNVPSWQTSCGKKLFHVSWDTMKTKWEQHFN